MVSKFTLITHVLGILVWETIHLASYVFEAIAKLPLPGFVAWVVGRERRAVQIPEGLVIGSRVPQWFGPARWLFSLIGFGDDYRSVDVSSFEGIPYATLSHRFAAPEAPLDAPPHDRQPPVVNPLRWWSDGFRIRSNVTISPQRCGPTVLDTPSLIYFPRVLLDWKTRGYCGSELECLQLNVWAPRNAENLPVMVFFHGGIFMFGSAHVKLMRGDHLARRGIVVVEANYRLGMQGYLNVPGFPSNRGLRDQLAALRWVKKNIRNFGGDPTRVTMAGQSAGAMSVGALLGVPALYEEELVRSAVLMSGSAQHTINRERSHCVSNDVREYLTTKLGKMDAASDVGFASTLSSLSMGELIAVQNAMEKVWMRRFHRQEIESFRWIPLSPSYGDTDDIHGEGGILPIHPVRLLKERLAAGKWVPQLAAGICDQEFSFLTGAVNTPSIPGSPKVDVTKMDRRLVLFFSSIPEEILTRDGGASAVDRANRIAAAYRDGQMIRRHHQTHVPLWNAINADWVFRLGTEYILDLYRQHGQQPFYYRFDEHSPIPRFGPTHIVDLHLFFGNIGNSPWFLHSLHLRRATALSHAMQHALVSFVKADKSADVISSVGWQPFDDRRACLVFGGDGDSTAQHMEQDVDVEELESWGNIAECEISCV